MGLWECSTFLSQFDGTTALSTVLIQFQLESMIYCVPIGVAYASAVLIGQSLGEGDADSARLYIKLTIFNTLAKAVPLAILSYLLRGYLPLIFTQDDDVIQMNINTFWLCALLMPIDHLQVGLENLCKCSPLQSYYYVLTLLLRKVIITC